MTKKTKKKVKGKRKKKFSLKMLCLFILYEIFFIVITSPLIIFYGPFSNLKRTFVGTIMGTRHQYFATMFLSEGKVDDILGKNKVANNTNSIDQNMDDIKIKSGGSNEVSRYDIHTNKFDGYLLEVTDPKKLKVAMTKGLGKQGQRTSQMAEDHGAIAAVNGGAFKDESPDGKQYAGTGAYPAGMVISEGKVIYKDVDDNTKCTVVGFNKEGKLIVGNHSINELLEMNAQEVLAFRPPTIIVNGQGMLEDDAGEGLNPRTAIGQKLDGTVLLLVTDGRGLLKQGASLRDVQDIMLKHGAWSAGMLDGGSSSTMYYNGDVINSPSNWNGERTVATSFYVLP